MIDENEDTESLEMVSYTGRTASGMIKQMLNLRSRSNSTSQGPDEIQSPMINGTLSSILDTPVHSTAINKQLAFQTSRSLTKLHNLRAQSEVFPSTREEIVFANENVQSESDGMCICPNR